MLSPPTSQAAASSSKRSACDRCRSQKLRCPRENGAQLCERCVRLGAQCVTSHSMVNAGESGDQRRAPVLTDGKLPVQPTVDLRSMEMGTRTVPTSSFSYGMSTGSAPANLDLIARSWPWLSHAESAPNDSLNLPENNSYPHLSDAFSFLEDAAFEIPLDLEVSPSSLGDSVGNSIGYATDTNNAFEKEESLSPMRMQNGNTALARAFESDPRLLSLGLHLSGRLQGSIATEPRLWDAAVARITRQECVGNGVDDDAMDHDRVDSSSTNSFGDALSDTSKFLAIIQSYGNSTGERTTSSPSKSRLSLGIIVVMNLISVYLQIIATYDHLFCRLHEQLNSKSSQEGSTSGSIAGPQPLPGLRLAGFLVQQGNLQTKILIQAILHQLEMIEKNLSLPVGFRVSDRCDEYTGGLLDSDRARALMEAIVKEEGVQYATAPNAVPSGFEALASLRLNIRKVKQFL